jgi:hypothetical protein
VERQRLHAEALGQRLDGPAQGRDRWKGIAHVGFGDDGSSRRWWWKTGNGNRGSGRVSWVPLWFKQRRTPKTPSGYGHQSPSLEGLRAPGTRLQQVRRRRGGSHCAMCGLFIRGLLESELQAADQAERVLAGAGTWLSTHWHSKRQHPFLLGWKVLAPAKATLSAGPATESPRDRAHRRRMRG